MALSTDAKAVRMMTARSSSMRFSSSSVAIAVEARHDVDDGRVEGQGARQLEAFSARRREADVVSLPRQERLENLAHDLFVIDDENRGVHSP
jgi:hypothetical protein